jgi:pimeloyl-ACP methyl ester carboxylesterase
MTPDERVNSMKNLTPSNKKCQLETEVFNVWGDNWLKSDPLVVKFKSNTIRFPSGPSQDVEDLLHGKSYYNPANIKAAVLIIRGEWDQYPDNIDAGKLFSSLENTAYKKYVVIEKGTHVMQLEKSPKQKNQENQIKKKKQSRYQLYDEILRFLKFEINTKLNSRF